MRRGGQTTRLKGQNITRSELKSGDNALSELQEDVNMLIGDLSTVSGEISQRHIEVEVRMLPPINTSNRPIYLRVLEWIRSKYPDVEPSTFVEQRWSVSSANFRSGYAMSKISRGKRVYYKVKKSNAYSHSLPSLVSVIPRIGVSMETEDFTYKGGPIMPVTRTRTRWSFPIQSHGVNGTIDLTHSEPAEGTSLYEIEIEINENFLSQGVTSQRFQTKHMMFLDYWIKQLVVVIRKSGVLILQDTYTSISKRFNKLLSIDPKINFIPSNILNKPKDLEKKDLSFLRPEKSRLFTQQIDQDLSGGEISSRLRAKKLFVPLLSAGPYSVSLKADGVRGFLFFDVSGVYIVYPAQRLITKIGGEGTQYPGAKKYLTGTILDGEIINRLGPDGTADTYKFLIFDILAYGGQDTRGMGRHADKRCKSYRFRLGEIKKFISSLRSIQESGKKGAVGSDYSFLILAAKPVTHLPSVNNIKGVLDYSVGPQFFEQVSEMVKLSKETQNTHGISWETDGLIFTPTERPYNEIRDAYGQKAFDGNYSLTRKAKPWEKLTIDFQVGKSEIGIMTILVIVGPSKYEPFSGSEGFEWNGNVDLDDLKEGRVYEFAWKYSDKFADNAFVAVREREDKPVPNAGSTAKSVWRLINNPMTDDDLSGKSLIFMRQYHNKVKRAVIENLASSVVNPILLDLGSGSGGDYFKWRNIGRVYAVEPDKINIRELISRIERRESVQSNIVSESMKIETVASHYTRMKKIHSRSVKREKIGSDGKTNNVVVINSKAEDMESLEKNVPIGEVNMVTMFNVLTFFYSDIEKLNHLIGVVKTFLKPGGYFAVIVVDGELILNSMQDSNTMTTRNITISKVEDPSCRRIFIKIKGSIVRGQLEYLVQPREFVQLMDNHGFRLIDERYLNEEKLMSQEEMWYSSLSKLMVFRFYSNPQKRDIRNLTKGLLERLMKKSLLAPLELQANPTILSTPKLGVSKVARLAVRQDDSSLLRAILRSVSDKYKNSTASMRTEYVIGLRSQLARLYSPEAHALVIKSVPAESPLRNIESMKEYIENTNNWIPEYLIPFICDSLNIDVYIIEGVDPIPRSVEGTVKGDRDAVVIYYLNQDSYESIGLISAEQRSLTTILKPGDEQRKMFV